MNFVILVGILLLGIPASSAVIHLRPLSAFYVPYDYSNGEPQYGIDMAAVEQTAYDEDARIAYAAGDKYIHVIDFGDMVRPKILTKVTLDTLANDIEMCGSYVAVAKQGPSSTDIGTVAIYEIYNRGEALFNKLLDIEVGYKPDMLHWTHDCSMIVVANEGEAAESADGQSFRNPEGSVSIIRFPGGMFGTHTVTTLGFESFNPDGAFYEAIGVRQPYKGQLTGEEQTMAQNLEPEYVTFSSDETKAYISLQENNAVAVVDLLSDRIEEIYPLGSKSWKYLLIDASDKDDGIDFKAFDINSFYQPDAIKTINYNNKDYIITANEGDKFEYTLGSNDWKELDRGEDIHDDGLLSGSVSSTLENQLNSDPDLGRLQFSVVDGLDRNGKVEKLYFYGGRGFSVFDADNFQSVFDSGDEIERKMAAYYPSMFNSNTKPDNPDTDMPIDSFDSRSDNLGPECESLEIGNFNGHTVLFVGIDRSAAIAIYSLAPGSEHPSFSFESIFRDGGTTETCSDLLQEERLGNLDPEDLRFISEDKSPTGNPLLMVTSTVSGTIAVYEVLE